MNAHVVPALAGPDRIGRSICSTTGHLSPINGVRANIHRHHCIALNIKTALKSRSISTA